MLSQPKNLFVRVQTRVQLIQLGWFLSARRNSVPPRESSREFANSASSLTIAMCRGAFSGSASLPPDSQHLVIIAASARSVVDSSRSTRDQYGGECRRPYSSHLIDQTVKAERVFLRRPPQYSIRFLGRFAYESSIINARRVSPSDSLSAILSIDPFQRGRALCTSWRYFRVASPLLITAGREEESSAKFLTARLARETAGNFSEKFRDQSRVKKSSAQRSATWILLTGLFPCRQKRRKIAKRREPRNLLSANEFRRG